MYPEHQLRIDRVRLSENPVDDYQRTWLESAGSGGSGGGEEENTEPPLHVTRAQYRTCAVQSFHDVLSTAAASSAISGLTTASAASAASTATTPTRAGLDCSEYMFPDVLSSSSSSTSSTAHVTSTASPSRDVPATATTASGDLNSLTKNQQFRLRQIQYSDQRVSSAINPNNCVLWDHHTGYVFFTGIWRLYQDVMHALVSLDRPDTQGFDRKAHCQLELDYVLSKCLYEQPQPVDSDAHFSRRKPTSKRGYRHSSTSASSSSSSSYAANPAATSAAAQTPSVAASSASSSPHYSDIHWHNLDTHFKESLCQLYRDTYHPTRDFEFQDLMKRIRGGYIKIQGTWLPFELTKAICVRFCFPIRYLLVPIFGPEFPHDCETWYKSFVGLFPPKSSSAAVSAQTASSPAVTTTVRERPQRLNLSVSNSLKRPRVDAELLDASQNLLKLSRNNISPQSSKQPVPVSPFYRNRASSWSPGFSTPQKPAHPYQYQPLPPIGPLLDSLEHNYPSPPSSATYIINKTNGRSNASTNSSEHFLSSPLTTDTRYFSPPMSPGYSTMPQAPNFHGVNPINNSYSNNFVATSSSSSAFGARPQLADASHSSMENVHSNPTAPNSFAHFYNSHGHKYSYPVGMQVMYHPRNIPVFKEQQPSHKSNSSGKDDFRVGVQ
ncbi:LAME_0G12970g1_1 [Lachancea meyersii CBS 8951]|uniref:LAME_0G12970g1_1 n=1 Tax=Lachancea meyersii CBS 8951 TaxID=1266667 RepID=A0A1G4K9W6_9SACH|nr:LAME_0G12970g1_1 [Lachancea meyersii CBS 8951]